MKTENENTDDSQLAGAKELTGIEINGTKITKESVSMVRWLISSQCQLEAYDELRGSLPFDPNLQQVLHLCHKAVEDHARRHLKKCYDINADVFVELTSFYDEVAKETAMTAPEDIPVFLKLLRQWKPLKEEAEK